MLVEKEVIAPGCYWYVDQQTDLPRKLEVTPELTKYWHEQGTKMLSAGLTIPVPYEHDFNAHPMTPKDKLLNNAGEIKEYRLKGDTLYGIVDIQDPDVKSKIGKSIRWTSPWINSFTDGAGTKWNNVISHLALTTRPRIVKQSPFTSIAAALSVATESRVTEKDPPYSKDGFCLSRAGLINDGAPAYPIAFSIYSGISLANTAHKPKGEGGGQFTSRQNAASKEAHEYSEEAHRMDAKSEHGKSALGHSKTALQKSDRIGRANYHNEAARVHGKARRHYSKSDSDLSMMHGMAQKAHEDAADTYRTPSTWRKLTRMIFSTQDKKPKGIPPEKTDSKPGDKAPPDLKDAGGNADPNADPNAKGDAEDPEDPNANPLADANGDIEMEELLCDLLQALGVPMPDESNEVEFKRHLYEAVMSKIKELTGKGMGKQEEEGKSNFKPDQNKPPNQQPNAAQPSNPLIQQEQQPMYMSLEEIDKLPDPMKGVALAMYNENIKLRSELDANSKVTASLRDAKLREASATRATRVALLSKLSPRVKADLDTMLTLPSMALSMGEGGTVVDPLAPTLAVLEKGLADIPRLLTADASALSVAAHPTDEDTLSEEQTNKLADDMARMMGCPKERKAS